MKLSNACSLSNPHKIFFAQSVPLLSAKQKRKRKWLLPERKYIPCLVTTCHLRDTSKTYAVDKIMNGANALP